MSISSIRKKSDLFTILRITIAWMIIGVLITFYDYIVTVNNDFYTQSDEYNFFKALGINLIGAIMGGVTAGSFIVLYATRKLRKKSFLTYVIINSVVILVLVFVIDFIAIITYWSFYNDSWIFSKETLIYASDGVFNILSIRSLAIWFSITFGTTFLIRISEGFGPGVVVDIIRGRYHKPIEEERIFMFLDIKSSTTIAEKLGHYKYFQLLSDFFADITDAIIYSKGDIYQYVGDEVVVSWRLKEGLQNNNCLNCFFEAQRVIKKEANRYLKDYDLVPEFKAGFHVGYATVGEIGVLKKIIAFSGDVLNTTARIQSTCNTFNAKLLVSEELKSKLVLDGQYAEHEIGEIELRGKQQKTKLFSITETI